MAAALVLAGCGSGDDSGDSSTAGVAQREGAGAAPEAPAQGEAAKPGADADAGAPVKFRLDERAIIYTGSITVRVDDVSRAASAATSIVTGVGGFIGGDKRASNDSYAEASLTLRVPADKFSSVVDRLAGLGKQEQRDINTEDVTEEALDLDARIASQRARVESGRRLLAQAKTLNDLILLEGELAKREADLASLEAKKRRMDDLTALSTITVTLLGPGAQVPSPEEDETGFLVGLKGGWTALVASLGVLLTVLGALLPWLAVLAVPVVAVLWLRRRVRRPVPTPPTP
ncbi:lipoprotein [Phytohabitans rumicis]|uniref:Lipoprotein n=1 Tax=Phytohabitans rumicis TaxID=1076125 RepID=A0A6V8L1X3_9ACTN|nr:lipoprotein [Phytohabitans rumicis]